MKPVDVVHLYALSVTFGTFSTLKVIELFADAEENILDQRI